MQGRYGGNLDRKDRSDINRDGLVRCLMTGEK